MKLTKKSNLSKSLFNLRLLYASDYFQYVEENSNVACPSVPNGKCVNNTFVCVNEPAAQ